TRWPRDWSSDVCSSDLLLIICSVTSAFRRSTTILDWVLTSAARASAGVIRSIALPPPAARDFRNSRMFRWTPVLPAGWFVTLRLLGGLATGREATRGTERTRGRLKRL